MQIAIPKTMVAPSIDSKAREWKATMHFPLASTKRNRTLLYQVVICQC